MLLHIFTILLPCFLLSTLLLVWRFRNMLKPFWKKAVAFLPGVLLPLWGMSLVAHRTFSPEEYKAVGFATIVILGSAAMVMIMALGCLVGRMLRRIAYAEKTVIVLSVACCVLLAVVCCYGYNKGIYHLRVTKEELTFDDLPASFDGYRIVFFSDFHLGTYATDATFPHKVTEALMKEQGDIILFGGDLINYDPRELQPFIKEMERLHAPDGVYAVMGNHDYQVHRKWSSPEACRRSVQELEGLIEKSGWKLLLNASSVVVRDTDSIAVVGVENDGNPPFPSLGDLGKALAGVPDSLHHQSFFKILVSHDPTHWKRRVLPDTDIQLTLSGHSHACQLQIGHYSPAAWVYKEWGGLYREEKHCLFVSKGIGEALLNFRFGAWPEINVITLRCKKNENTI